MKLLYRGSQYNHRSAAVSGEIEAVEGKYRGQNCNYLHLRTKTAHSKPHLTYRGVAY
jgi:hypothetical protein